MNLNRSLSNLLILALGALVVSFTAAAPSAGNSKNQTVNNANTRDIDRVIAVVNSDVITQRELNDRVAIVSKQFKDAKRPVPPAEDFDRLVLERLIIERIQYQEAVSKGMRVIDEELNTIINNLANQKKMTLDQYKVAVEKQQGKPFAKYREELRRDVLITRFREREVDSKLKISEAEIDAFIASRNASPSIQAQAGVSSTDLINLAQILIPVPEKATEAEIAALKQKAENILSQAKSEKDFVQFANGLMKADSSVRVQDLGYRIPDRLPQIFVEATAGLSSGQILPELLQSQAGFHILKVLERKGKPVVQARPSAGSKDVIVVSQNEVRHILIKARQGQNEEEVARRLAAFRDQVKAKVADFSAIARRVSEDKQSAPNGGYLGWISPGQLMPEFEQAVAALQPGEVSDPVRTEYGWHLIQLINRKQSELSSSKQKEFARATLRQTKFEQVYQDWLRELRDSATVELREPYNKK